MAPGGKTLREAQRRLPGFLDQTDEHIRLLQGEAQPVDPEELIDTLPKSWNLNDKETVALLDGEGADVALEEGWMSREQAGRYRRVLHGIEQPREHVTTSQLVEMAKALKSPSVQTVRAWESALESFLEHARVAYPTSATREHAVAFRASLLARVAPPSYR